MKKISLGNGEDRFQFKIYDADVVFAILTEVSINY